MFDRTLKERSLERWQPTLYGGHLALDMSNRYFSSRRLNGSATPTPFQETVDPEGILADMARDDLVHCDENNVMYCKLVSGGDGEEERSEDSTTPQIPPTDLINQIYSHGSCRF
jgi:hypothetical protein